MAQEMEELREALSLEKKSRTVSPEKVQTIVENVIKVKQAEHRAGVLRVEEEWEQKVDGIEVQHDWLSVSLIRAALMQSLVDGCPRPQYQATPSKGRGKRRND